MSFKSKLFSSLAMGAAVAVFAVAGSAQTPTEQKPEGGKKMEKRWGKGDGLGKGMRGGKRGMHGGFGLRGIELTDAQKEQIKAIREANKPSEELRAQHQEQMKAFREARKAGTLTEEQKTQMKAFRDERMAKMQAMRAQIEAILTPEQKQQLEARKAERQQRMEQRRELRQQRRQSGEKPSN
ncbi:MAG: Spy/CpxP family protein refolding chaperone [Pyrinomonadaceae bacterium]|nr:Spy/CpxP family protein refolding chaperone [Pyrinomonadaceae bacterium]